MNLQTKEILAEMGDDTLETAHNLEVLLGYRIDAAWGTTWDTTESEFSRERFYFSIIGPNFSRVMLDVPELTVFTETLDEALKHEGLTPTMLRMKMELRGEAQ